MQRPPRKKNAPIITRRLLYRVLFSASIIVIGTLFVYVFALEDDNMSRREQTMVRIDSFVLMSGAFLCRDLSCPFSRVVWVASWISLKANHTHFFS